MYLKTLSAVTVTFLAILFVIMIQTVPTATTMTTAGDFFPTIKANCASVEAIYENLPLHI